jgi:hypothetical protein
MHTTHGSADASRATSAGIHIVRQHSGWGNRGWGSTIALPIALSLTHEVQPVAAYGDSGKVVENVDVVLPGATLMEAL